MPRSIFFRTAAILVSLALLEGALRLQQALGPVYDLEFKLAGYEGISDITNHRRSPGTTSYRTRYGNRIIRFNQYHEEDGVKLESLRPTYPDDGSVFKVLFLGDSFMEGYDDSNTIPQFIWEYLRGTPLSGKRIEFMNAGCTSYSPIVYIIQAKLLIPKRKPDYVVVDIDESDIMDDYTRKIDGIVRDKSGGVVAAKHSDGDYAFIRGFVKIRQQPLYLVRLFMKVYHTRIYMPKMTREYCRRLPPWKGPLTTLQDSSPDAAKIYAREIDFFKDSVSELAQTLVSLMHDKRRIMFIYHSHRLHLKGDGKGFYGNTFTIDTLKKVCGKYDITLYDATADLKRSFQGDLDRFYTPRDQYAHFAHDGMKIFSDFVAQRLTPAITELLAEGNRARQP